ncbi:MAG: hypothetical protein OEZ68_15920 [Gammaproteobacteria bacterium]|nr:hypothetical protein [Gammaproteobacteria bacterium]MDH5802289.1 hypothetical protein [Gammaproteobacteria bacterium]
MLINTPVYTFENGTHFVIVYSEAEDGTFRRTQSEPLRLLKNDIKGVSIAQGDLVSSHYDRYDRVWKTPTVTYHYGKPQSFYQFLREKIARNQFFVFTKPTMSGHITKFQVHELQLKNGTSQRKISILKEKYCEALTLWTEEELQSNQISNAATVLYKDNRPTRNDTVRQMDAVDLDKTVLMNVAAKSPKIGPEQEKKQRRNLVRAFSLDRKTEQKSDQSGTDHFYQRFIIDLD